eukprot:1141646-Pelagomonas_calceolata.AAC.2
MALKHPILSGDSILAHCSNLENTLRRRKLEHLSLQNYYTPNHGNFNCALLNNYLSNLNWIADVSFPVCLSTWLHWHTLHGHLATIDTTGIQNVLSNTSVLHFADPSTPEQDAWEQLAHQTFSCPPSENNRGTLSQQHYVNYLKIITFNVKGLYKSKEDMNDLLEYYDPHIVSFTETKLTPYKKEPPAWLCTLLQGYSWWHGPHHQRGTLLCMKKSIAITTQASPLDVPPTIQGRVVAIKMHTPHLPILLFST